MGELAENGYLFCCRHFNSSNLLCDCDLAWLPTWLKELGFQDQVDARCSHPAYLKGRSIFDLKPEELTCSKLTNSVCDTSLIGYMPK